jgi:hypothetical protein
MPWTVYRGCEGKQSYINVGNWKIFGIDSTGYWAYNLKMSNDADLSLFEGEKPYFEESFHQNGQIFWYASDIVRSLGYKDYTPTLKPIQKALSVCMSTNIDTSEQIREEWREINWKHVKDFKLSRFACYLVAMNADIKKPEVARSLSDFAIFCEFYMLLDSILKKFSTNFRQNICY